MAIAPSNNLLSALSQLQSNARPVPPARPVQQQPTSNSQQAASAQNSPVPSSFAAQLANTDNAIRTRATEQRPAVQQPQGFAGLVQQTQSRPIATKGGYLGQHVNILV